MSQDAEVKCPCSSCGGNISFPVSALGMLVNCPHCRQETFLAAVEAVAPLPVASPVSAVQDDAVVVTPSAPVAPTPPPPPAPPPSKPKRGGKIGKNKAKGGPPPPPPSTMVASSKPPPPPPAIHKRKIPGPRARSSPGMGAAGAAAKAAGKGMSNRSLGIDALWEDEVEELLTASELRCQSCGRKYQKGLLFCPNCNEVVVGWLVWLRRMGWLVVITLSVLAFLNYRRLYPPAPTGADGGPQKGGVEMLGHSLKREKYGRLSYIRGVVTNHSPVDFFYVKVEFDLLDAKGRRLGTVSDQRSVMSSNAVWNYKALVLDPDGARYENPRVSAVR